MYEKKVYRLMPNEYKSFTSLRAYSGSWIASNGLVIKKGGEEIPLKTAFAVDDGCEIEVIRKSKSYGKVKYIKSTPKRKYYKFITWYILFLEIISAILIAYEIGVNNNYAKDGSRTEYILFTLLTPWLALSSVVLRNNKGFTKWAMTILSYLILIVSTVNLIKYFIALL